MRLYPLRTPPLDPRFDTSRAVGIDLHVREVGLLLRPDQPPHGVDQTIRSGATPWTRADSTITDRTRL